MFFIQSVNCTWPSKLVKFFNFIITLSLAMNLEDFVKVSKTKQSGAAGSDKVKEEKPDHGQMEEPRRDMDQGINRNSVLTVTAIYLSKKK